jgi:MFS family permease
VKNFVPYILNMQRIRATVSDRFPAFASRDFAIFWIGHLLSLIGTSMQNTAQPLLAYRLSGRPFDLGLIGFALTLPTFFLALPGGVFIEHWDKRKTVIILQAIMMFDAFALSLLTLAGRIQIWHIVLLSLILGIATAFEITARQAMLIELVGIEALPNAIALQSTAFNLSRVLGPALTAPILLAFPQNGEGWIFLVNGLSFVTIIISLMFVQTRFREAVKPVTKSLFKELVEGQEYISRTASVAMIILITTILGLFAFPIIQQIPVLSKDVLSQASDTKASVDARNSALYIAQGTGALVAAFLLTMNNSARGRGRRLVLGEASFIFGIIGLGFVRSLWPALILICLMGWGAVTQLATMNTLLQLQVPNELRGRVFSIYLWALQGVAPLGSLLIGWATQQWGLSLTAVTCGTICLLTIGSIQFLRPDVRKSGG